MDDKYQNIKIRSNEMSFILKTVEEMFSFSFWGQSNILSCVAGRTTLYPEDLEVYRKVLKRQVEFDPTAAVRAVTSPYEVEEPDNSKKNLI